MAKTDKKIRIFSALEVANICGVVNQTAINWIKSGHLKAFTTPGGQYRIYAEDLLKFLEERGMRVPDEVERLAGGDRKYLVIVEDDADLNDMLEELFTRRLEGYEVLQAYDGFEAGTLVSAHKPDIVVLDMSLPGVDGHKLIRSIKGGEETGKPIVIAISGIPAEIAEEKKTLDEGADAFFSKPIDLDALVGKVTTLVGQGSSRGS